MATEACCTPAPPATPEFVGKEETLSGHAVYSTGSSTMSALILVCDIFGYKTPLLRKLADKVAAAGYLVVVPDVLQGDPFAGSFAAGEFPPWLAKHPAATGYALESTKALVEALKDKGISSIGACGFCWGAKVVVTLAKEKDVKAIVQFHPSLVHKSDYEEVAVPIAVLAAPTDGIEQYEELLASRSDVKSFVKIFPDVRHGWTVRYDETNEIAVEQANEAHKLMLDWFAKYL